MDLPQLKLLAGRVRDLLRQSSSIIGHSHALDLVAALPGLRNWPEVIAFPDRVAASELDVTSTGRLAFRLRKNFSLEFTPQDLLSALAPDRLGASPTLQVWPGGPPSGVYVTTSPEAINALLTVYEEATDGGLVYAERAGSAWEGSINLGEYGLWSPGIDRLPSGTLLVIGPLQLDQRSWKEEADRLEMACLHAFDWGHRVAVLVDTPAPELLCEDLTVLVRSATADPSNAETALVGVVTTDGQLSRRRPFALPYPQPALQRATADIDALPESARELLRRELARHASGIVLFGASEIVEHTAFEQVAACLALTEHAGPAARIMSRHRGTPAKDWQVPEAIKALPFLPSIASAYAQGYRRMVIEPHYVNDDLVDYEDVLFIGGTYGHDVARIALKIIVGPSQRDRRLRDRLVGVLGLLQVPGKTGLAVACDLFLRGESRAPVDGDCEQFEAFMKANRACRWEGELTSLLTRGLTTVTAVRKARAGHEVSDFLNRRRSVKKSS
jgi:hypothetical protein